MTEPKVGTIYLLHLTKPLGHAKHYLGWTSDLDERLRRHRGESDRGSRGSRLVQAAMEAGSDFVLARTWRGDRYYERKLKKAGGKTKFCPLCTARPTVPVGGEELFRCARVE